VVKVVQQANFVGVVAVSAVLARQAMDSLHARWNSSDASFHNDPTVSNEQTVEAAYAWQCSSTAESSGQSVTAWCTTSHVTVWASGIADYQRVLKDELSALLDVPQERITVVDVLPEQSRVNTLLDVLDAAASAALLSRAVQRPVCVAVQRSTVTTELVLAPSESTSTWVANQPWAVRPSLARLLSHPTRAEPVALPRVVGAESLTLTASYDGSVLSQASIADIEAMQVFAQESLLDDQASQLGIDPVEYRLTHVPEGPGRTLIKHVADQSEWATLARPPELAALSQSSRPASEGAPAGQSLAVQETDSGPRLRGRGCAVAHVRDEASDDAGVETWSAWVVEVEVEPTTGRVDVTRLVVGHDSQSLKTAQPASIHDQNPQLLDAARRLLQAPASFDDWGATGSLERSPAEHSLSTLNTSADHAIDIPVERGQLALDGVMTLPAAAAIGNAIFDATGVRLRKVPFDTDYLKASLAAQLPIPVSRNRWARRGAMWLAAGAGAVAGVISMAWPLKSAIAPTTGPDTSLYSDAAIERGRLVAAAGDCMVCHTAKDGAVNAGGLALDTPFGTIYTTNITPDNETGIGQWSYKAFERAMREGIHRDGRQLYPAFPYTSFAKLTDADMQALYAYLMVQPPVRSEPPKTELAFPYNLRPLLAGWNAMFHDTGVFEPDPSQSVMWNRGAYLVEGAGHCTACHSPRNTLGAEKTGVGNYLAGGEAEGWSAPALDRLATGKVPWTEESLFQYLRTGYSANHGVAAGPMAPVIHGLAELPESDVRAMTTYLLNLPGSVKPQPTPAATAALASAAPVAAVAEVSSSLDQAEPLRLFGSRANGERIYQNACAVCHEANAGPTLFGVKPLLAVNTNLHADTPDNLVQVILHGIQNPANDDLGYMPGFKDSLDDEQVQDLISYLRARFAPQESEWADSREVIGQIRSQSH